METNQEPRSPKSQLSQVTQDLLAKQESPSQRQLARKLGVSASMIGDWIAEKIDPSEMRVKNYRRLAEAMGWDIGQLDEFIYSLEDKKKHISETDSENETLSEIKQILTRQEIKLNQLLNKKAMNQKETARDRARGKEREIAELLGVDLQIIYEWVNSSGKTLDIPVSKVFDLADFLGVDISVEDILEDITPNQLPKPNNETSTEQKMENDSRSPLENGYHL